MTHCDPFGICIKRLEPVSLDHVRAMLDTCERRTVIGDRDRALLMFLLDSGVRHAELCALNVGDVNPSTGAVMVREGKGCKPRVTFIGPKTRRASRAFARPKDAQQPTTVETESAGEVIQVAQVGGQAVQSVVDAVSINLGDVVAGRVLVGHGPISDDLADFSGFAIVSGDGIYYDISSGFRIAAGGEQAVLIDGDGLTLTAVDQNASTAKWVHESEYAAQHWMRYTGAVDHYIEAIGYGTGGDERP
jgi:hypothetical protein